MQLPAPTPLDYLHSNPGQGSRPVQQAAHVLHNSEARAMISKTLLMMETIRVRAVDVRSSVTDTLSGDHLIVSLGCSLCDARVSI